MEKWSFQRIRELMTPIALRGMAGNKIGCARISMMVRSMNSNARPDTLMQDRTLQAHRFLLQRTAGPYIWVRLGHSAMSARCPVFPKADTTRRSMSTRPSVMGPVMSRFPEGSLRRRAHASVRGRRRGRHTMLSEGTVSLSRYAWFVG